ncbi:MAG: endopeptidase La [Spirochaetales bacterium]|nr:endopeptidase La [Spirochaetales bacterium]
MSDNPLIPADQLLPNKLSLVPLEMRPIFPGIFTPLMITDPADVAVVEDAMSGAKVLGLVLVRQEANSEQEDAPEVLYDIGTAAKILKKINLPDGGVNIFVTTLKRFQIKKMLTEDPFRTAAVEYLDEIIDEKFSQEIKALTRSIFADMKTLSENNPLFSEEMRLNMVNIDQPGKLTDFIASILNINKDEQQKLLETLDVRERMQHVLLAIKKEQELVKLQKKISKQINEKLEKNQREFFLREELKTIQKELGITSDAKTSDYQKFKEKIESFQFSGELKETVTSELEKFALMDPNSSEFIVTRNYLETICSLPWKQEALEMVDMAYAKRVLDQDHYGLEDVKKRILEFLAIKKLKSDSKGSIVLLLGPPGVGKTSIGKSIAKALKRPFFRFSVGGMRDEAEIKGHRRTYVGAMPGKIIQGLKITGTRNPVFMIDEIDKLGSSYQGDPSSALLEVLDPEQNINFRDHYVDLPFDISHVLFIATANALDTIPRPLLDRMEIIRLSGYIEEEKVAIAQKYLIPKSLEAAGLGKNNVKYSKKTLSEISRHYAREAGMRNFEKALDRIHRKLALKVVTENVPLPLTVDSTSLEEYLGRPSFPEEEEIPLVSPGMVMGLAWTSYGGAVLIIEAVRTPGKGGIRLTGRMGDVMKESAQIAYTWVHAHAKVLGISEAFFDRWSVHLHIPEGATPKDGPSAGVTMATALASLAMGKVVLSKTAMTGELSLTGKVMPIGGLKEKVIAARRSGVKTILFPKSNEKDWEEIPDYIRKGLEFKPINRMEEVLEIMLGVNLNELRAKKKGDA